MIINRDQSHRQAYSLTGPFQTKKFLNLGLSLGGGGLDSRKTIPLFQDDCSQQSEFPKRLPALPEYPIMLSRLLSSCAGLSRDKSTQSHYHDGRG
jgi:hypothetical protein